MRIAANLEPALDTILWEVVAGKIALHQLTPALSGFYLIGYDHGATSRQAEIDHLSHTADRYYYELCRRQGRPFLDPNSKSFDELQQIRREMYEQNAVEVGR